MTDEELNIAVAERVMGATVRRAKILSGAGTVTIVSATKDGLVYNIPCFATDWRAFGLVVEAMAKRGWTDLSWKVFDDEVCATWGGCKHFAVTFYESTRLRAACLAAIEAVESEVQP